VRAAKMLPVLVSIAVVAALAVPVINVAVQQLGVGSAVVASPVGSAKVDYVFGYDSGGRLVLTAVKVSFDRDLPKGSYIRVELRDGNDNLVSSGEVTLTKDLKKDDTITIDLSPDLDYAKIVAFTKVVIVVAGPQITN